MTVRVVAHELGDIRIYIFRNNLVVRRVDDEQCVCRVHDGPDAMPIQSRKDPEQSVACTVRSSKSGCPHGCLKVDFEEGKNSVRETGAVYRDHRFFRFSSSMLRNYRLAGFAGLPTNDYALVGGATRKYS